MTPTTELIVQLRGWADDLTAIGDTGLPPVLRAAAERLEEMSGWRSIITAPRNGTRILLLTSDFGAVEGWWNKDVANFYKSQRGWASYDPENATGDWVSNWRIGAADEHGRLFCGATPLAWAPLPVGRRTLPQRPR